MKKGLKISLVTIFVIVIGSFIANHFFLSTYPDKNIWKKKDRPLVIAHAGGRDLNPENTMRAFKYAYSLEVDVLEMDALMTSDTVLVAHHGENETGNISLQSDGDGLVHKMTYDELQKYNFGYNFKDEKGNYPYRNCTQDEVFKLEINIPRIEDVFKTFGKNIHYNIEIKANGDARHEEIVEELFRLIEKYDLENHVLVSSFLDDINDFFTSKNPRVAQSTSKRSTIEFLIKHLFGFSFLFKPGNNAALEIPVKRKASFLGEIDLTSKALIEKAHQMNMAVYYWTINDVDEMKRLIEKGADGIITDRPDIMISLIEKMKKENNK
jgi:glycerophosphoryl diester phosphodiesterase